MFQCLCYNNSGDNMKHKMIFIEGLPGSGKTTFLKRLNDYFNKNNIQTRFYTEGDLHPIDLAWCAILSKEEYESTLQKYVTYQDQIKSLTKPYEDKYILAYTKVRVDDKDANFFDELGKYEIYRADDFEQFKNTHLKLWKSFQPDNHVYLFECIYLQNHINELILKFNKSKEEIISYFKTLMNQVKEHNPLLLYIKQKDVRKTLEHTIEQRRSDNPTYKDWIDLVIDYFEQAPYAKELNYLGYEGAIRYFIDRNNLELNIIKEIGIDVVVFELDGDYDTVFEQIKKVDF